MKQVSQVENQFSFTVITLARDRQFDYIVWHNSIKKKRENLRFQCPLSHTASNFWGLWRTRLPWTKLVLCALCEGEMFTVYNRYRRGPRSVFNIAHKRRQVVSIELQRLPYAWKLVWLCFGPFGRYTQPGQGGTHSAHSNRVLMGTCGQITFHLEIQRWEQSRNWCAF